jgi:hypothetical protein
MDFTSIVSKVLELGGLVAKHVAIAADATNTLTSAMRNELTAEELDSEIARIKVSERDQVAEDWNTVNT